MNAELINKIALVGSDSNLHVAALLLSKNLQQYGVKITCVELSEANESTPVAHVGAEFSTLFEIIGANQFDAINVCRGIFSYGTVCRTEGHQWFCPYGQYGLVNAENEFEQGLFRYFSQNGGHLDDYSLAAAASKNGKFAIAGTNKPELQSALRYGALLDARLYKNYLKSVAVKAGVEIIECEKIDNIIRKNDFQIKQITVDQSTDINADFWFDCSGDSACLGAGLDGRKKMVSGQRLMHDRVAYFLADDDGQVDEPFSTARYAENKIVKKMPLRNETWYEVHFNSCVSDEAECENSIEHNFDAQVSYQFTEELKLGVLPGPWVGNCLFVGYSGNNLGSSVLPESSLVQEAVVRFLDAYPSPVSQQALARGYNEDWARVIEEATDFIVFHALLLSKEADGFDDDGLSDSLRKRINLFKRLGRLPVAETDIVRDQQWYAMLYGAGYRPELHSIMIASLTDQEIEKTMRQLKSILNKIEKTMPPMRQFLNRFCS